MTGLIKALPSMDGEGLAFYKKLLPTSSCYLEYGGGASTVYAATVAKVPVIISVESDKEWCEKIKASLVGVDSEVIIEHCDIGSVGDWGKPKNRDKVNDYWQYMSMPWHTASNKSLIPDTILIDGRFRVASFLFSLISARVGSTILFDDYLDRPHYFIVEDFCSLQQKAGRMGVFTVTKNFCIQTICEKIAQYSIQVE